MAAINKNFVIKNGLEVDTNLIFADSQTNKVGIGTTAPQYLLHVNGGIGVTDVYVSGIATITTGIVTNLTSTNLNVTGIGTIVTGNITNLTNTNLNVTGIATIATLNATGIGVTNFTVYNNLSVGGISTFTNGPVLIGSGTSTGTASQTLQVTGGTYVSGNLGIGSTNPTSALFVVGDARVTGVITATTFSGNVNAGVGTITTLSSTNGTITNLTGTAGTITTFNSTNGTITNLTSTNLTGTAGTITTFNSTSGTITNLTGTAGTITTLSSTNGTITNLNVTGISTLGTVKISSGIVTATSGVVTYFGDGNFLNLTSNPSRGIGIGTTGGVVGYGITFLDLKGAGVSTTQYNSNTGIATIFFEGGGGGGSISISTTAPLLPGSGDLWYSPDYGRTFIYYDENTVGYGTDAFWVDAAPFNVGVITSTAFAPASASAPSIHFAGDVQTGFFSPSSGNITAVSVGSSILNVNPSGIVVTGVTTSTKVRVGTASTFTEDLVVNGSARVVGILTIGSSSITIDGTSNIINVGAGIAINGNTGIISATQVFVDGVSLTSGNITPTSIVVGSGVTINASGIVASGIITATDFNATSDINLKENILTVENALDVVNHLRGVSFDWKENGRSSYGVIAQELEAVLPELVGNGETKSVNYNGIIGVLIEAIKELKKEVEEFKSAK